MLLSREEIRQQRLFYYETREVLDVYKYQKTSIATNFINWTNNLLIANHYSDQDITIMDLNYAWETISLMHHYEKHIAQMEANLRAVELSLSLYDENW